MNLNTKKIGTNECGTYTQYCGLELISRPKITQFSKPKSTLVLQGDGLRNEIRTKKSHSYDFQKRKKNSKLNFSLCERNGQFKLARLKIPFVNERD